MSTSTFRKKAPSRASGLTDRASRATAAMSRLKLGSSASTAFKISRRGPSTKHQRGPIAAALNRREGLRVIVDGEDVTPRALTHPQFSVYTREKRAFFDSVDTIIGVDNTAVQLRPSLTSISSLSTIYASSADGAKDATGEKAVVNFFPLDSVECRDVVSDDDAPSQYHLSKIEQKRFKPEEKVVVVLKETETCFVYDNPQLTEDANSEAGKAVLAENERYQSMKSGRRRKVLDAETQTPQIYVKTVGTYVGRVERANHATFVNNWVFYDTFVDQDEGKLCKNKGDTAKITDRYKFPSSVEPKKGKKEKADSTTQDPLDSIKLEEKESYEDALRITSRLLASKNFEAAQKRFTGLTKQDPCDLALELTYDIEILWKFESPQVEGRPVSAFTWNPINSSVLAVGYSSPEKEPKDEESVSGLVIIWCAKNPSKADRVYEFDSRVSSLDWSKSRPNVLAVGFYDGMVRLIDVSKKDLTVLRKADRKTILSFEPHWQVQWWPTSNKELLAAGECEQLFTGNQDGRVCCFASDSDFNATEILRLHSIEGEVRGINRAKVCNGPEIPINRHPGVMVLRLNPENPDDFLVGTEEGCVLRCSTTQPSLQFATFLAHDGPCYNMEYSPFCSKLLLTCGADWRARIWAEGIESPLMEFGSSMAPVYAATWSPRNSTVFASAAVNEVCIWDIRRKTHRPTSTTQLAPDKARITSLEFTSSGEQIVAADDLGTVYVCNLVGMPLPALEPQKALVEAVCKALVIKPELLQRVRKLGKPFNVMS